MRKVNKRKIKKAKTLESRMVHKKRYSVGPFVQVKKSKKREINKKEKIHETLLKRKKITTTVNCFSLAVIKIPWYKKISRTFLSFFGHYYG